MSSMRIEWAIPCRYCEANGGLMTIVGAGTNIFFVPAFPGAVGVHIALSIVGAENEASEKHRFKAHVLGPQMEPVTPTIEGELEFAGSDTKPPGWEERLFIPTAHQFPVQEPGTYTVEMTIDDRSFTVPLLVAEAPPGAQPA